MLVRRVLILGIVGILLFSLGFLTNTLVEKKSVNDSGRPDFKDYPLLAKRVFIENPNDPIINFAPLRQSINQYISDNNLQGSLYFEYLPTGTSIRISGDSEQVAASLIKLPAALDLYRAAELGKLDLDKEVTLQESWLDGAYGELYKKGAGYKIKLREAARIMLEDSDNTALKAIAFNTANTIDIKDRAFNALDIDITQNPDLTVSISARSYSSFLKCLYFSCYLNHEHSQEILSYLSKSHFDNRLIAGISDKSIIVAHKIGVASTTTQSDCGIIYLPNRNYVLCVMIRGQDGASTDKHMAALSKMTYEYLTSK